MPSSCKEYIKADLDLTDTETGYAASAFLIVFMLTSPIFGFLSDKGVSRKLLISIGKKSLFRFLFWREKKQIERNFKIHMETD